MNAKIEKINGKTYITKKNGTPLKILQLTDIHIGGGIFTKENDRLALDTVKKIVTAANPDFVAVTGDIVYPMWLSGGSHNNKKSAKIFANTMKELGVNWAFTFGNHDTEIWAKLDKNKMTEFYKSYDNCLAEKGDASVFGMSNYPIIVRNSDGSLNTVLMFIDSNAYLTWNFFSGFDTIHADQIEWYKNTIKTIGAEYDKKPEDVRSLAFFHIPPKEFREAWEKFYRGDKDVIYHHGFVNEKDNYFGYPKTVEGKFFDEMVKFKSCKGMFMGHDHLNTLSLTYKGIRLTYGMSVDYLAYKGIKKRHTQRGGTIIEIYDDGSFDTKMLPLDDIDGKSFFETGK